MMRRTLARLNTALITATAEMAKQSTQSAWMSG